MYHPGLTKPAVERAPALQDTVAADPGRQWVLDTRVNLLPAQQHRRQDLLMCVVRTAGAAAECQRRAAYGLDLAFSWKTRAIETPAGGPVCKVK